MFLRKPAYISIAILLALVISGCGQPVASYEPVTITFSCPVVDEAYYESLIPAFNEAYPHITVEIDAYTNNPSTSADAVVLQWYQTLNGDLDRLSMRTLDSYLERSQDYPADAFYPDALGAFAQEDDAQELHTYAIPLGIEPWVMFYNKELFDKFNLPYPENDWDLASFRSTALALRSTENHTYGYANAAFGYFDSLIFLYLYGGSLSDAAGYPTINNPINTEAVEWYVDLYDNNQIAPKRAQAETDFGYGQNPSILGISDGKIGMFVGTLSSRGGMGYPEPWEFEWGMSAFPQGETSFTLAFYEGGAIPVKSLHPDEAWLWIDFLSHQVPNNIVPARLKLAESKDFEERVGAEIAEISRQAMETALLLTRENVQNFGISIDIYISMIDSIINSGLDIARELDRAQRNALLRQP